MRTLAILGVSLFLLATIAAPVSAGVEPSPWQPQINELDAVTNHLVAIMMQLNTASILTGVVPSQFQPMGFEPTPWQPAVSHLDAITTQLGVLGGRVDAALAIAPSSDLGVAASLAAVGAAAKDVADEAGALDGLLPPECDAALAGVISVAGDIIALAGTVTIVADRSDFEVFENGFNTDAENLSDWGVGDTGGAPADPYTNIGRRGLVKFSVTGLGSIASAQLHLTILESRKDQYADNGTTDTIPPVTNPGLGDTVVVHVADYGTPSQAAYGAASIGNDPGVLIGGATEPEGLVAIDVTNAVKQAITAGASVVAFRIQTVDVTDRDDLNDVWFFASANNPNSAAWPAMRVSYR